MANFQQVDYTRIKDEDNKEEVTGTVASPIQQRPATAPQPVMVPQQPMIMAPPPPARVQYMPQEGPVQYMPQGGAMQYIPQGAAMQYMPQHVEPLFKGSVPHVNLLPNDYLTVTLVLVIICAILNISSLFLGIPALIFSITAYNAKGTGNYMQAKTHGNVAMGLNIANIVYTLVTGTLIIGLTIGLHCSRYPYGYYNSC